MILRQIFRLVSTDLKRFIKSPKAILLLLFTIFFAYDFVRVVAPYAEGLDVAVSFWVYPVFMDDWGNSLYILLLICVLMSDAPFRNGSELYLQLRVSKYVWMAAKLIYILVLSAIYQVVLAVLCVVVFIPQVGVGYGSSWGYVLRAYYGGTSGSLDASGNVVDSSLLDYAPIQATLQQLLLASLVAAMLGTLMFLLNTLCKNYMGTILVSVLSCFHLLLSDFGFYNMISFDSLLVPTSWIKLSGFSSRFTPYMAEGILVGILAVLAIALAALLKLRRIEVCAIGE